MILVDVNLLMYAVVGQSLQHSAAKSWLERQFSSGDRVGLPWSSLTGFLRLTTNPRIFERPLTLPAAWSYVMSWTSFPNVWIPRETDDHAAIVASLLPYAGSGANLVPDLHLAALTISHGLTLCSADTDFARFPPLRWVNPLLP